MCCVLHAQVSQQLGCTASSTSCSGCLMKRDPTALRVAFTAVPSVCSVEAICTGSQMRNPKVNCDADQTQLVMVLPLFLFAVGSMD